MGTKTLKQMASKYDLLQCLSIVSRIKEFLKLNETFMESSFDVTEGEESGVFDTEAFLCVTDEKIGK